jgi:hypothetical protein
MAHDNEVHPQAGFRVSLKANSSDWSDWHQGAAAKKRLFPCGWTAREQIDHFTAIARYWPGLPGPKNENHLS